MTSVTIYHNPRCTKSRQTLALLTERHLEPEVIEYLKNPPDAATLRSILRGLELPAHELVREKERNAAGLPETDNEDQILKQIVQHPEILQRPIVVSGGRARLGRPPENVLDIV